MFLILSLLPNVAYLYSAKSVGKTEILQQFWLSKEAEIRIINANRINLTYQST